MRSFRYGWVVRRRWAERLRLRDGYRAHGDRADRGCRPPPRPDRESAEPGLARHGGGRAKGRSARRVRTVRGMDPRRTQPDADPTEQITPPPAEAAPAPPLSPSRRPADRWSTVFTVFAAIALVALLLLGAAVISSQGVAVPSSSPSPSASPTALPSITATPAPRTPTPSPTQAPSPSPTPTSTPAATTPAPTTARPSGPATTTPPTPSRTP